MLLHISRYVSLTSVRGLRRLHSLSGAPIDVSQEVQDALQRGSAVVALETAFVTHGMPWPVNLETSLNVQKIVRASGAIPATIGLLDGRVKVGLSTAQLERLADVEGNPGFLKLSRRDLAAAVGLGISGGTTISATSLLASLVGIRVFATGGLGGVHRGGEISWDVSADLTELGRTPIAVVSAGVKSILDIGRTLEYLETQGVAVFTYGTSHEFPGFYGPATGHKSPWRVDSPEAAANIIDAAHRFGLKSGMLFAAPIPEAYAGAAGIIQDAVDKAVQESEENGMSRHGKDVTPWLLARVAELTQGRSIPSNVAIMENTASIGGSIAVEYAKLSKDVVEQQDTRSSGHHRHGKKAHDKEDPTIAESHRSAMLPPSSLIVVGAAAVDVTSQLGEAADVETSLTIHSTSPGRVSFSAGGVARNMAEAAHRILSTSVDPRPHSVLLISPLGNDIFGGIVTENARKLAMRTDGFLQADPSQRSAVCSMFLDIKGNLATGVADMTITQTLGAAPIIELVEKHKPRVVAFDANLNPTTLASLVRFCNQRQIHTFFEPTSIVKSISIIPALHEMIEQPHFHSTPITFASPNLLELSHLFHEARSPGQDLLAKPQWWSVIDGLGLGSQYRSDLASLAQQQASNSEGGDLSFLMGGTAQMAVSLLPFFQHLFIKCGEKGVFLAMRITGEAASNSRWAVERTRLEQRQVVAKGKESILVLKHYSALPLAFGEALNVTGAGDSFVGTLLADLSQSDILDTPDSIHQAVRRAQRASVLSLYSSEAVSPSLSDSKVAND